MSSPDAPIIFGQPWFDAAEEELVLQTLRSGWIGQGPLVERFEHRLETYLGAEHVVAVSSCTAGLQLALVALEIGPGDEVITTPFTFIATLNAIEHVGATPVLVDVDRASLNLAPAAVAAAITERTRVILPVHFAGRPLDVEGFYDLADAEDLWIVEDAAHAIGAVAAGNRVGGSGHARSIAVFSFYPNKNLSSAEGGAIALSDGGLADRIRRLRLHGLDIDAWKRYKDAEYRPSLAVEPGYKHNWTDLQAAIALPQLEKLEGFLASREYLAGVYDELLEGVQGVRPVDRGPTNLYWRHALHLYQLELDGEPGYRDDVLRRLRDDGVGAAVHYIGVNHHPYYADRFPARFPVSDWASESVLTLPLHLHLSRAQLEHVVATVVSACRARR